MGRTVIRDDGQQRDAALAYTFDESAFAVIVDSSQAGHVRIRGWRRCARP